MAAVVHLLPLLVVNCLLLQILPVMGHQMCPVSNNIQIHNGIVSYVPGYNNGRCPNRGYFCRVVSCCVWIIFFIHALLYLCSFRT